MWNRLARALLVMVVGLLLGLATVALAGQRKPGRAAPADGYLFCFWNVENLFDDKLEDHPNHADKEFDRWFAEDHKTRQEKFDNLSKALIQLNDGKGPDILAVAEVESVRAAELLQQALNRRLSDPALHYSAPVMKNLAAGRHIAPAILTRLPVERDRTRLHGNRLRILEGHVRVRGHDLTVLATHWTSRVTDHEGDHRDKYGDVIYGVFKGMYRTNPEVDLLVCGDFNDPPDDESVTRHLHAVGDVQAVLRPRGEPLLLDLFAGKDPAAGWGTHYYNGRWLIFDQIVVSPGLLDTRGWSCDPKSAHTVNTLVRAGDKQHRPWRFGSERDKAPRGYSDHFPVTARLYVH